MKGRKWTPKEDSILRKMTLQGCFASQIAHELVRSKFAVYNRREKLINQEKINLRGGWCNGCLLPCFS